MKKKWIAINLILLLTTVLLAWKLNDSILRFQQNHRLSQIRPAANLKQNAGRDKVSLQPPENKAANPAEFAVIPERNLFSESRSKEETSAVSVLAETPPLAQKPILVGITISENQKFASIIDPSGSFQSQRSRVQTRRIGDVYQGYTITNIAPDYIVLESGTRREIIPIHEGIKRPLGGKTPIQSTRVISFGGGATAGTIAPTIIPTTPAGAARGAAAPTTPPASRGQAPQTIPSPAGAPGMAIQPGGAGRGANLGRGTGPARTPAAAGPQQSEPAPANRSVIRTPLGDIVRPNP